MVTWWQWILVGIMALLVLYLAVVLFWPIKDPWGYYRGSGWDELR